MEHDYSIKSIKKQFQKQGIYYTPKELAEKLMSYIDVSYGAVYDPTCGRGNLLAVFPEDVPKYGQDVNEPEVEMAKKLLNNFHGYVGDTLVVDGFEDMVFDAIVANPPFSIRWNPREILKDAPTIPTKSKADYAFLLHVIKKLSDRGKAAVLNFPGVAYRKNREGTLREWMIEENYIERVVRIPGDTFEDTAIETLILVFSKHKETTDIIFEDGKKVRTVSIDEVRDNDYVLSVNNYIYDEPEDVSLSIEERWELEKESRCSLIENVRQSLMISKLIYSIEGEECFNPVPFGEEIIKTVQEAIKG